MIYRMKKWCVFCCALLLCLPSWSGAATVPNKVRVVDDTGYELILEAPATRVLALYGALSELVLALDKGDTLIGRTSADANIEGLRHLPAVGTHMRPNPELIVALKPHVVLQFLGRKEARALGLGLRKLGVPVLLFHLENFEDINSVLLRLGVLTDSREKAQKLVKSYTSRIGFLRTILMDERRKSVFYEVRYPNLLAAGGESIVTDIIAVAGGRNVVLSPERVLRMNEEALLRYDPEVYIVQKGPMNRDPKPLDERRHFSTLRAVKDGKVLYVDELSFARPGPRAIDAAEKLAYWLHPTVNFDFALPAVNNDLQRN